MTMPADFVPWNFSVDPQVYYLFYIGELKNLGLTSYLENFFSRRLGKKVQTIAIVPDQLEQYNYSNLILYRPNHSADPADETMVPESCRCSTPSFLREVSSSPYVEDLVARILENQEELYVYMYESCPDMTLDRIAGVTLLGPDKNLAQKFNNKAWQFQELQHLVPVVDFRICSTFDELICVTDELRPVWDRGIFVSRVYSAAGAASLIARNRQQIEQKFSREDAPFLISRYMVHDFDPTVLGVVANEQDVYIAGVADQCIEDGNRFAGSIWPSILPEKVIDQLVEQTRTVGKMLGRNGYRGIFGCDYIVTADNKVRFIEINARKQGTTLQFCLALQQILPNGAPSLPELEYYAVMENRLPENCVEPVFTAHQNFCWGTYNYKLFQDCRTTGYIPQNVHQQESFSRVARGKLKKDYLVVEHVGAGRLVRQGTFLSRVIAVAATREDVQDSLANGKKLIELTIAS
jgi:hypothetical protein